MNLSRHRILIFMVLSVLLHGLVVLYSPRQYSFPEREMPGMQAIRIEMMTVPAAPLPQVQPTPVEQKSPPTQESPPAHVSEPPPPIAEAPPQQVTQPRPEASPVQEPQPASLEPPRETMAAALPANADEDTEHLDRFAQATRTDIPSSPQPLASLPPAAVPQRDSARIDALRQEYLRSLPPLIRPHQRYPLAAQRAGREGTVVVRFVLERDGRLRETSILQSSGDALLDQAAATAIERVRSFPPFPAELPEESLPIELPVRFDRSLR